MSVLVELVSIRGKDGCHIERIVLPPFKTDAHGKVGEWFLLGCHVVAHSQTKLVYKAYLLDTGRVFVALYLHLYVVGKVERYVACSAFAWYTIQLSVVW